MLSIAERKAEINVTREYVYSIQEGDNSWRYRHEGDSHLQYQVLSLFVRPRTGCSLTEQWSTSWSAGGPGFHHQKHKTLKERNVQTEWRGEEVNKLLLNNVCAYEVKKQKSFHSSSASPGPVTPTLSVTDNLPMFSSQQSKATNTWELISWLLCRQSIGMLLKGTQCEF